MGVLDLHDVVSMLASASVDGIGSAMNVPMLEVEAQSGREVCADSIIRNSAERNSSTVDADLTTTVENASHTAFAAAIEGRKMLDELSDIPIAAKAQGDQFRECQFKATELIEARDKLRHDIDQLKSLM